MSASASLQPLAASNCASARPIPDPAPVTTATLPLSEYMIPPIYAGLNATRTVIRRQVVEAVGGAFASTTYPALFSLDDDSATTLSVSGETQRATRMPSS